MTLFLDFWSVYPRKVGKLDALKAYSAMIRQGYSEAEILSGAVSFAEMCRQEHTEARFIPHPATWLRAGRWMDENITSFQPLDPRAIEEAKDKADRLLRRGKYSSGMN